MKRKEEILSIFPVRIRDKFIHVAEMSENLQEIRLSAEVPIRVVFDGREFFLDSAGEICLGEKEERLIIRAGEMEQIFNHICSYSRYAFEDDIRQGFLTMPGGHRVGLAGQVTLDESGHVKNIKYIRYMNIRIAHELSGISTGLFPYLIEGEKIKNTLLIGPPCSGKTTMLRDMIRQISNGTETFRGRNVGLVDERSEIAGSYLGFAKNEVGIRTVIMDACPKREGIMMLIRSMAPEVIAVDEIGGQEDMEAIMVAEKCGCNILATMHGYGMSDLKKYRIDMSGFDRYVFLKNERRAIRKFEIRNQEGKILNA